MDGPVPIIAFFLLVGLVLTSIVTTIFVVISFKSQLTTKAPTHLSLANIAVLALLTMVSLTVSRTGIGITPFMIFLGILLISIIACIRIIRRSNVECTNRPNKNINPTHFSMAEIVFRFTITQFQPLKNAKR